MNRLDENHLRRHAETENKVSVNAQLKIVHTGPREGSFPV